MNNSFPRLIDGMCATLRQEVLPRLDDEFARGQVFGLLNLLNTFKVRADWSSGFLVQQIAVQQQALSAVKNLLPAQARATPAGLAQTPAPQVKPIADLLALRDQGNQALCDLLAWLDGQALDGTLAQKIDAILRQAMRSETEIELKNSSKPMFAQMSSGKED